MKKNEQTSVNEVGSENYNLKSQAVEDLVNAEKGDTPVYSREELQKFRSGTKFKIPMPVKILFIKIWFPGAVCFFFLWGLGTYIGSLLDMLFILGVVMGMVTDLLVNNIIRFIETFPGENDEWMFLPKKGMGSFLLNILYSFLVIFCVYMVYCLINYGVGVMTGNMDVVFLGVEPILFGVFSMGVDLLFVGIKNLVTSIFRDARAAAGSGSDPDRDASSN